MASKRGQKTGTDKPASNGKAPSAGPANAWARPLKTTGPPPGMGPAKTSAPLSNNSSGKKNSAKNSNSATSQVSSVHRERMLHLSLTLIGQKIVATLTDGTVLEGVFHTFTPFEALAADTRNRFVLKAVKVTKHGTENKVKDGSTAILAVDKISFIVAKNIKIDRHNGGGFAGAGKAGKDDVITDTQISGARGGQNRDLVAAGTAWTTAAAKQTRAEALAGALEDTKGTRKSFGTAAKTESGLQGSIGGWDQFRANQELFNVKASFDENLYTTQLDKSQIDSRKIAEAERIAKEIENTTSSNIHVAEERGHVVETDYDEEDRFSGVLTKDGKQRHEADAAKSVPTAQKKMNYAAAAAGSKSENEQKVPPGFRDAQDKKEKNVEEAKASKPSEKEPQDASKKETVPAKGASKEEVKNDKSAAEDGEDKAKKEPKVVEKAEKKADGEKQDTKPKSSKLNANAKAFTFNPSAKSFTPGAGTASFSAPTQQQPQHVADPSLQMHGGRPMQPPHYMHAGPMGQPGMMPIMSPQYPGMRYPPQFTGMEQHGATQMQTQQAQHTKATPASGSQAQSTPAQSATVTPKTSSKGDSAKPTQEGDASQSTGAASEQSQPHQQQHQQIPQQQHIAVPYNVPPQGAYFGGGAAMGIHPRGPGYPPQFVGGPQQMPVGPGGTPYRQMYPMQPGGMPPNMHMRGPGGSPYYPAPGNPMPYPPGAYHGMMDEGDANFRGRGRGPGRGRGRRGGRGGRGPGRGHYQHGQYDGTSARSTSQQQGGGGDGNSAFEATTEKPKESIDKTGGQKS